MKFHILARAVLEIEYGKNWRVMKKSWCVRAVFS